MAEDQEPKRWASAAEVADVLGVHPAMCGICASGEIQSKHRRSEPEGYGLSPIPFNSETAGSTNRTISAESRI